MGITLDQVQGLSKHIERDDIDMTKCASMDDFILAILSKRDTETLEDIVNGLVAVTSEPVLRLAAVELLKRKEN